MIGLSVNVRDSEISENNRHFAQLHKFLPYLASLFPVLKGKYNTVQANCYPDHLRGDYLVTWEILGTSPLHKFVTDYVLVKLTNAHIVL